MEGLGTERLQGVRVLQIHAHGLQGALVDRAHFRSEFWLVDHPSEVHYFESIIMSMNQDAEITKQYITREK